MKAVILSDNSDFLLRNLFGITPAEFMINALITRNISDIALFSGDDTGLLSRSLGEELQDRANLTFLLGEDIISQISCFMEDDKNILIINGACIFDVCFEELASFHDSRASDVTLLLTKTTDPEGLTMAQTDADKKILCLTQSPDWNIVRSNSAVSGIFIASRAFLSKNSGICFSDFSELVRETQNAYGTELTGYVKALRTGADIRSFMRDVMSDSFGIAEKISDKLPELLCCHAYKEAFPWAEISAPAYIGNGVKIGRGAKIGPASVISDGSTIKENACIFGSYIGNSASIGENTIIKESVIFENASIEKDVLLARGCSVGKNAHISKGEHLFENSTVPAGAHFGKSIKYVTSRGIFITDDGVFDGEWCFDLGRRIVSEKNGSFLVFSSADERSVLISRLIASGINSAGADTYTADGVNLGACMYLSRKMKRVCVYVSREDCGCLIRFFAASGLPITYRKICSGAYQKNVRDIGINAPLISVDKVYDDMLLSKFESVAGKINLLGSGAEYDAAVRIFNRLKISTEDENSKETYILSGTKLKIVSRDGKTEINGSRLLALSAFVFFSEGNRSPFLCLPKDAHEVMMSAKETGGRVLVCELSDESIMDEGIENAPYSLDPVLILVHLALYSLHEKKSVCELSRGLPVIYHKNNIIPCKSGKKAEKIDSLLKKCSNEGARLLNFRRGKGFISIEPGEDDTFSLYASGEKAEYAEEICSFFERLLS